MGYKVKLQMIERPKGNHSYYVNLPIALVKMLSLGKGEDFEWSLVDDRTFLLKRARPPKDRIKKLTQQG